MKRNRQRTCGGKRRYRDHAEATGALRRVARSSQRQKIPVRCYWCDTCKGWHITSRRTWREA
ncbi:MAG: hypothetical protein WKF96_00195 [Solirubrobacteraceae bacterium]